MQERDLGHCELSATLDIDGKPMKYELTRRADCHILQIERDGVQMSIRGDNEREIRKMLSYISVFFHKLDNSF